MKIILDKTKCIGCGICASNCSNFFEIDKENKSHLKKSEINVITKKEELETKDIDCIAKSVLACPMQCIEIKK